MKKSQLMGCNEGTERLISQEDTLRESLQVNGFQKLTYLQQQPAFAEDNLGESSQSCIMEEQMQENQEQTGPNQFTPVNRDNDTTGHSQPDETTLNAEEKTEITANELKSELDTHCEETVTSNDISSIKCDDTLAKIKFHLHDTTPKHSDTESEYCDCKSMVSVDSNPGAVIRDRTDVKSDISLEDEDKSSISSSESLKTSSCSSICTFARSTQSTLVDFCRICHCEGDAEVGPLIAPCNCRGSLRYVHQNCLQQWIKSSDSKHCELCGYHFVMDSEMKPFLKWKKLSMSTNERRKIMCSVMFHIIAITCVIWSLYVLIEKTTEEINNGNLQWPFWTKLVVVAIGFTGGLIFMYVQCKVYVQLWKRLKAFNRVIYVKNNSIKDGSTEDHSTIDAGSVGSNIEPQKNHSSVTGISQSTSGRDGVVVIEMANQDNQV